MCFTDEKDIVNLYCMDYFYSEQMALVHALLYLFVLQMRKTL